MTTQIYFTLHVIYFTLSVNNKRIQQLLKIIKRDKSILFANISSHYITLNYL